MDRTEGVGQPGEPHQLPDGEPAEVLRHLRGMVARAEADGRTEEAERLRAHAERWATDPSTTALQVYDRIGAPGLVTVRLDKIAIEKVEWVWPGYLPVGKLVVLDGDPGLGKSTLALNLAARITTGSPMPDGVRVGTESRNVVLLSAEDGIGDTIRPRFESAGGDPVRIRAVTAVQSVDDEGHESYRLPVLPTDIDRLERLVRWQQARLVIVDVLAAYLDGRVNSYRDQDVRLALYPLSVMADRTGCVVLVLRHLNKSGGGVALYRGGGSIGITGGARAVLMVGKDPADDKRNVLAVVKCNLAPLAPSMAYRLVPDDLYGCVRVQWEGVIDAGADDLVAPVDHDERSAGSEAEQFLIDLLDGRKVPAREVWNEARDAGIAPRTLKRAKAKLDVRSERDGFGGPWLWTLPEGHRVPKGATPRHGTLWPPMGSESPGAAVEADTDPADPGIF